MPSFEEGFQRAMQAASSAEWGKKAQSLTGSVGEIADLSRDLSYHSHGSDDWRRARSLLFRSLEKGLKQWMKRHPPGVTGGYAADDPNRAVWLFHEHLKSDPHPLMDEITDILLAQGSANMIRTARKAIVSLRSKKTSSERDRVAAAFPEYPDVLKKIREAKKRWNVADRAAKTTHAFRMMGAWARMGLPEQNEYDRLVDKARSMEKTTLGKPLTGRTKPS